MTLTKFVDKPLPLVSVVFFDAARYQTFQSEAATMDGKKLGEAWKQTRAPNIAPKILWLFGQ